MKRLILLVLLASLVAILREAASVEDTSDYFTIHSILSSPEGIFTFSDGRQISAKAFSIGGCASYDGLKTGSSFPSSASNYTIMSYDTKGSSTVCKVNTETGSNVYDSAQIIKVVANGWAMTPTDISIFDIDSDIDVTVGQEWRDSAAVFGFRDGNLVVPNVQLSSDTLLVSEDYTVPSSVFSDIDIISGNAIVTGTKFAPNPDALVNCPTNNFASNEAGRCRSSNLFPTSVDTLVFLYAATRTSESDFVAAVIFSQVGIPGGCLCAKKSRQKVLVPKNDGSGLCEEQTSSGDSYVCDVAGTEWCESMEVVGYKRDAPCTPNGCPCSATNSSKSIRITSYSPTSTDSEREDLF